jgi:hypothetical protein
MSAWLIFRAVFSAAGLGLLLDFFAKGTPCKR